MAFLQKGQMDTIQRLGVNVVNKFYPEIKRFDWMLQVMWLVLKN